jgi:hypothetical protein
VGVYVHRPGFQDAARVVVDTVSHVRLRSVRPPRPARTYPDRHVTTVLRLPAATASAIEDRLAPLRARWPEHRWYPAESMHTTALNLNDVPPTTVDLLDAVRAAARRVERVELRYARFGLSPDSGLLWTDLGTDLARLRDALRETTGVAVPAGITGRLFTRIAFVNVVRFTTAPPTDLLRAWRRLAPLERADFVTTLDFVRTDRYLAPDATELVARVELGTGAVVAGDEADA